MRRVGVTECAILECDAPPSSKAVLLFDLDGDGRNELIVGSTRGTISVFKDAGSGGAPFAECALDPGLGNLVVLASGHFLGFNQGPKLAALTAEGRCVLMAVDSTKPALETVASQAAPLNVTAAAGVPRGSGEALVVGTSGGELRVLGFAEHTPCAHRAQGDDSAEVTSLAHFRPAAAPGGDSGLRLAVGLLNGRVEVRGWPELDLLRATVHGEGSGAVICAGLGTPCADPSTHVPVWSTVMVTARGASFCDCADDGGAEISIDGGFAQPNERFCEPCISVAEVPALASSFVGTYDEASSGQDPRKPPPTGSILVACSATGRTTFVDVPPSRRSSGNASRRDGDLGGCIFDASPLFASPLRAFVAGAFSVPEVLAPLRRIPAPRVLNRAPSLPPPPLRDLAEQHGPSTLNDARASLSPRPAPLAPWCEEQTCLVYALASGEILVFHSLAAQVGASPLLRRSYCTNAASSVTTENAPLGALEALALEKGAKPWNRRILMGRKLEPAASALRSGVQRETKSEDGHPWGRGSSAAEATQMARAGALRWATHLSQTEAGAIKADIQRMRSQERRGNGEGLGRDSASE